MVTHKLLIITTTCLLFFLTHNLYLKSRLDQLDTILARQHSGPASRTGGGKPSSQVVLYNRVPKTGSTSLMNIAYELYKHNK